MPKKRTNFKHFEGSSLYQLPGGSRDGAEKAASVNERLGELRKVEGSDAARKKRELAESVNQKSIPPQLGGLLGVPESAPPPARHGVRSRTAVRTPGPAPPQSWIKWRLAAIPAVVIRGGKSRSQGSLESGHGRPWSGELYRFSRLVGSASQFSGGPPPSLVHLALKTAAQYWELFDEQDLPALGELPVRLRSALFSYLGQYGRSPMEMAAFAALTQGSEPVKTLDLAGLVGYGLLTLPRFSKLAKADFREVETTQEANTVAESWDETVMSSLKLAPTPALSRFSHVTHLCLSHPAPDVLWRDLLSFSKHIPAVTHLSLAYWPRPTLTPNLATTTIRDRYNREVRAGGSHYYSELDKDYAEPRALLHQLSSNLLRLQWLDLEGCTEWISALDVGADVVLEPAAHTDEDQWTASSGGHRFMLDNWKNLTYVYVAQDWRPSASDIRALGPCWNESAMYRVVLGWYTKTFKLREVLSLDDESAETAVDAQKRRTHMWVQNEVQNAMVGGHVNATRHQSSCRLVMFDHGWMQRAVPNTMAL